MRRFQWPLQRVLDVKIQQERAMRMELVRLSQDIAAAHRDLFRRQASLRGVLADLAGQAVEQRLPEQQEFMLRSAIEEAQLDRLREELKALQDRRSEKTIALSRIRSARETLEGLREESLLEHTRAALKQDQKKLDESSHLVVARELIAQRIGAAEQGV